MKQQFKKLRLAFWGGLLLLGLATPALAQNQGGTLTLDPFTGAFLLPGQHRNNAYYSGLRIGVNLTDRLAAEAMFGFFGTEDWDNAFARDNRMVNTYRFGLDGLFHFNEDGKFVPFVAVGGGVLHFDNPDWANQTHGLFDYGVGFKWFLADFVALRGDGRHLLYRESGDIESGVELTIGLSFMLGGEKSATAAPAETAAKATPPTIVCTSPDNGVNGVATDRNVVATFSEPMERSAISGASFTVNRGETPVAGKVSFDADNAAIFNPTTELDKGTVYTATMAAGVKDREGETLAAPYVWNFTTIAGPRVVTAVLITLEDAHFDFNSAALTENGKTILDSNAKILKANPKMNIRIAGYTSASGTQEYNQTLSEQRATTVKDYIIKHGGIDKARLTKIGYGESRPAEFEPVPSNIYSEEAKANMRVLFEVIVK